MFRRLRKLFSFGSASGDPYIVGFTPRVDSIKCYRVWGRPPAGELPVRRKQCISDWPVRVAHWGHLLRGRRTHRRRALVRRPPSHHQVPASDPRTKGHGAALVRIAGPNGRALRRIPPTRGRLGSLAYLPASVLQRVRGMCFVCLFGAHRVCLYSWAGVL